MVARDQHEIHFRCAKPPTASPDKYDDELLDAYCSLKMQTSSMTSTQLEAWSSLADLGICRGSHASLS